MWMDFKLFVCYYYYLSMQLWKIFNTIFPSSLMLAQNFSFVRTKKKKRQIPSSFDTRSLRHLTPVPPPTLTPEIGQCGDGNRRRRRRSRPLSFSISAGVHSHCGLVEHQTRGNPTTTAATAATATFIPLTNFGRAPLAHFIPFV